MRIIFFGTSNVALPILETLSRHHEIAAVVTMPDKPSGRTQVLSESPVSVLAREINLQVLKPAQVKNNSEFYQTLQNIGAELFVVVSYGHILPPDIINLPKYKTINVHFSLLPKYRGPSPIQTALLNGDVETGTTIFILDEQVDHGPILAQKKMPIDADDNVISLAQKLAFTSAELIIPTIEDYAAGTITAQPQDDKQATHTERIDKARARIDWQKPARQIYNQFRAFYLWPGVWTKWEGKNLKITDCAVANPEPQGETAENPGMVLAGGIVACGQSSFLQIKSLQLEGKRETDIRSFLNGYPRFIGSNLD